MEDFVPFELAKKLKEKGFSLNKEDIEFIGCRLIFSDECTIKRISTIGAYNKEYFGENIDCPTIQQVLNWLREVKKIFVLIDIRTDLTFFYEIWGIEIALHPLGCVPFQKYQSYEKAAIAGIEYVLNNLI